jgi:hypothetical protein
MSVKRTFLLVEGPDDIRFFNSIISPILEKNNHYVTIIAHRTKTKKQICNIVRFCENQCIPYFYFEDIDSFPSIQRKKSRIDEKLQKDLMNIIIVIKEIESWYLAGIEDRDLKSLGIKVKISDTNNIIKERFQEILPKKYDSQIDFMIDVLKNFSIQNAIRKNCSFEYFMRKFNCYLRSHNNLFRPE